MKFIDILDYLWPERRRTYIDQVKELIEHQENLGEQQDVEPYLTAIVDSLSEELKTTTDIVSNNTDLIKKLVASVKFIKEHLVKY